MVANEEEAVACAAYYALLYRLWCINLGKRNFSAYCMVFVVVTPCCVKNLHALLCVAF